MASVTIPPDFQPATMRATFAGRLQFIRTPVIIGGSPRRRRGRSATVGRNCPPQIAWSRQRCLERPDATANAERERRYHFALLRSFVAPIWITDDLISAQGRRGITRPAKCFEGGSIC
jgi:hypothetical protein